MPLPTESINKLQTAARLQKLHLPTAAAADPQPSRLACPALLLLKRSPGALPVVSVLLPAGWVMPFWQQLAYTGTLYRRW